MVGGRAARSALFILVLTGLGCRSAVPPPTIADVPAIQRAIAARRGAPLLVNFWALWCDPCMQELPDMGRVESRFSKSGIRVLGVSCDLFVEDDTPALHRKMVRALGEAKATYTNLIYKGRDEILIKSFELPGPIPHSILFGPDGAEIERWTGQLSLDELAAALDRPREPRGPPRASQAPGIE